jgi:hypothetical protein
MRFFDRLPAVRRAVRELERERERNFRLNLENLRMAAELRDLRATASGSSRRLLHLEDSLMIAAQALENGSDPSQVSSALWEAANGNPDALRRPFREKASRRDDLPSFEPSAFAATVVVRGSSPG